MKKNIFNLCLMTFLLFGSLTFANAQKTVSYIIVETDAGVVSEIKSSSVNRQYIEAGEWVFEMKETNEKKSYPLDKLLPFKIELRNANSTTNIEVVKQQKEWNIYDDGDYLVISKQDEAIGNYSVFDLYGQKIKEEYESGNQAFVKVPSGNIYIVKVDGKAKKIIKK